MGEIAEMMLDGTLCEGCGDYLGADRGFPVYCASCSVARGVSRISQPVGKVACPYCKKKVKAAGLQDHIKDVHNKKEKP